MVGALLKSGVMLRTLSVSLLSLQHYGLVKVSVLLLYLFSIPRERIQFIDVCLQPSYLSHEQLQCQNKTPLSPHPRLFRYLLASYGFFF